MSSDCILTRNVKRPESRIIRLRSTQRIIGIVIQICIHVNLNLGSRRILRTQQTELRANLIPHSRQITPVDKQTRDNVLASIFRFEFRPKSKQHFVRDKTRNSR